MKRLAVLAVAFATVLAGATAQAAIMPAPVLGDATPNVQLVGVVCGPGMHLRGAVCVRNAAVRVVVPGVRVVVPVARVKVCPGGWHLVAGVCRR